MVYLWIAVLCITSVLCVDYSELERMGVACDPRDTCQGRDSTTNFPDINCECGSTCISYNDCCVDGPKATQYGPKRIEGLTCIPVQPDQGVYGISRCSASWNGPADVKSNCENPSLSDLLMNIPVTEARKAVTYRNPYCAMCNSASTSDLTLWNLKITCNSLSEERSGYKNITEKFIEENLVRVGDSWGVYHWNKKIGDTTFFPCDVGIAVPPSVRNGIRYCRPGLVSSCARNWNRKSVRTDCDSYMAVVYINGKVYRNAHCAMCNHVSPEDAECFPPGEGEISTELLSWAILVDIAEKNRKCPTGQVYDPPFRKCRRLICNSGFVLSKGECVRN